METAVESPLPNSATTVFLERTIGASELGATERAGEAFPLQGVPWTGSSDPLESPNYEEAMRKWVEDGGFKSQGLEESHQPVEGFSPPLVTKLKTASNRKQVLEVASEYLVGLLGGKEGPLEAAVSEGGHAEALGGNVGNGEEGNVDLGLDQLMQIIPALTELCDADVETSGLLDETQGVRLLGGVCRALAPVDEAAVWLSELCKNALCGPCEDAFPVVDGGLPRSSSRQEEDERPLPGGSDGGAKQPLDERPPPEGGPVAEARSPGRSSIPNAPLSESNPAAGEQPAGKTGQGRIEKEPVGVAGGDVAAQRDDAAGQADDVAGDLADVSQVQVAVELVRLGVIMLRTAERFVEKRKGMWVALAGDESLHATLARFRFHVGELSTAFGGVRKVAGRLSVLACLVALCEELGSTKFGVLGDAGGLRTGRLVAEEIGQEDAKGLNTGGGSGGDEKHTRSAEAGSMDREQGADFQEGPTDDRILGANDTRRQSDGEEAALVGDEREAVDEEMVPDIPKGDKGKGKRKESPDGEARLADGEGAEPSAESVPRSRPGRNRKAPSAWWAAPAADEAAPGNVRKKGKGAAESVRKRKGSALETAGNRREPTDNARSAEGASGNARPLESRPEATGEAGVEIGGEAAEIDLDEEEMRYDKRSKRRRKALSYKRRKAQARAPSQNRFVAYAIEEQMLDSESEWDDDQYSDLEDFIALENEDVDFKTMPLSTITPYVPYGDAEEDPVAGAEAQVPAPGDQSLGAA